MARMIGKMERTALLALGVAAAVALMFSGADAQAQPFDNGTVDDVDFGPTQATGGSNLDFNVAEFELGIGGGGGYFGYSAYDDGSLSDYYYGSNYGRYVYSFRSINGSFSNDNQAGTKRVFVEWMMTEPDTTKRSLINTSLEQKHDVIMRVTLYTTGGTTTQGYDEVEDCGVNATATSSRADEVPTSVRVTLSCKREALENMGFNDDEIDCIEEALETRSRTMRYVWRD
jgi:hypothetical protein